MRILALGAAAAATVSLWACGPGSRDGSPVDAPESTIDAPITPDMSRVYAHSATALYRLDATSLQAMPIGAFTGLKTGESLTDLAIDKDDHMIGVSEATLYSIDAATAKATVIKTLATGASGATSLSFVPSPTDPAADILITANNQGDVYEIETTTGAATKIGSYGTTAAGKIISSGDVIGVRGFGIYATVNVGTEPYDYLARIDPTNGWKATPLGTGTGFDKIFGLGFWGGKIYGFVDNGTTGGGTGKIIQIDENTGAGTELKPGAVRWYGAGVATDAPIIE